MVVVIVVVIVVLGFFLGITFTILTFGVTIFLAVVLMIGAAGTMVGLILWCIRMTSFPSQLLHHSLKMHMNATTEKSVVTTYRVIFDE